MDLVKEAVQKLMIGDRSADLVKAFSKFNCKVKVKVVNRERAGPWELYELEMKGNTREVHIRARAPDVQDRLQVKRLIIEKLEQQLFVLISDDEPEYDHLPDILARGSCLDRLGQKQLPYPVGFISFINEPLVIDLAEAPHMLMGGSSGSGKSIGLQMAVAAIAYTKTPAEANFVLIDTGATDLMCFEGLPHLSCPIVQNQESAVLVLSSVSSEMARRIKLEHAAPDEYAVLPRLVVVVDEFPALFIGLNDKERKPLRDTLSALLQRGRHAKIHLVLAAQNPTAQQMKVEVGNITTRIAFRCAKKNFSEVILGEGGAENLTGKGELLMKNPQFDGTQRVQGVYATPDELHQLVCRIRQRHSGASKAGTKFTIQAEILQAPDVGDGPSADALTVPVKAKSSVEDQTFANVLLWALGQGSISVNTAMEQFHLGWNKANKLVKRLEELGVVGELDAKLPRSVVPTEIDDLPAEMLEFLQRNGITSEAVCQTLAARGKN